MDTDNLIPVSAAASAIWRRGLRNQVERRMTWGDAADAACKCTVSALSASLASLAAWTRSEDSGMALRIGCKGLVNLAARVSKTGVEKRIGVWEGDFGD